MSDFNFLLTTLRKHPPYLTLFCSNDDFVFVFPRIDLLNNNICDGAFVATKLDFRTSDRHHELITQVNSSPSPWL